MTIEAQESSFPLHAQNTPTAMQMQMTTTAILKPILRPTAKRTKQKKKMTKIRISHMSDFSCGETKVRNDLKGAHMARERSVSDVCEVLALVSRRVIKHCLCISREICSYRAIAIQTIYRWSNM